jgi:hypothetical protein
MDRRTAVPLVKGKQHNQVQLQLIVLNAGKKEGIQKRTSSITGTK